MSTTPSAATNQKPQPRAFPSAPAGDPESLLREAFDDVALVVGGVAVLHQLDDDLIWTLMKRLDRIRVRLLRDLKGHAQQDIFEPSPVSPPRVPAAVEEFLLRNRAGMGE